MDTYKELKTLFTGTAVTIGLVVALFVIAIMAFLLFNGSSQYDLLAKCFEWSLQGDLDTAQQMQCGILPALGGAVPFAEYAN